MTTAVLDPGAVITEAIRELVHSVRQLVEPDTDDPGVLDDLARLLGRARRKVNKAKKSGVAGPPTAAPHPLPGATTVNPARPAAPPGTATTTQPPASTRTRTVTLPIPGATPQRPETPVKKPPGPEVPMPTALASPWPRRVRRLLAYAVLVALVILMITLLASCDTPGSGPPTTSRGEPNAPTVSACRAVVTNEDIARMRQAIDGTADILFFQADKAAVAIEALRTPGSDVNVEPTVAAAMRTASEQAQAIRKKPDYATNFDRQAWVAMIAGVDVACKLAGVDMTVPS